MSTIQEFAKSASSNRDVYLDFIKGVAAVNIILIHTAFWSGEGYVPDEIKTLTLALDVPFFFFCSGIGATYVNSLRKTMFSLINIYIKYILFLIFYYVCLLVFGIFSGNFEGVNILNFIYNMFFLRTENTALRVVMGSIWFMPVYYTVIPIGAVILRKMRSAVSGDEKEFQKLSNCALFVIFMGLIYTYLGKNFLYLSSTTLVYLFFYFLGVICSNKSIKRFSFVIISWISLCIGLKLLAVQFGVELSDMQSLKFPPNIIYVLYSLFIIVFALYIRNKIKLTEGNFFCWVGKSAIYFYFCQGISSSLLMYFIPQLNWVWYAKLPVAFMLNFIMTLIIVLIFKHICKYTEKVIIQVSKCATNRLK